MFIQYGIQPPVPTLPFRLFHQKSVRATDTKNRTPRPTDRPMTVDLSDGAGLSSDTGLIVLYNWRVGIQGLKCLPIKPSSGIAQKKRPVSVVHIACVTTIRIASFCMSPILLKAEGVWTLRH